MDTDVQSNDIDETKAPLTQKNEVSKKKKKKLATQEKEA